jgi:hypothetical protein
LDFEFRNSTLFLRFNVNCNAKTTPLLVAKLKEELLPEWPGGVAFRLHFFFRTAALQ